MIVHNEYLRVQIEWSQTMQDTLYGLSQDEELWDKFRDFIQEKFPGVDTFHTDCIDYRAAERVAAVLEREAKTDEKDS